MKIVVVASLAWSLVNFRGRLLSAMIDAGHDVTACAPDEDRDVADRLSTLGVRYRVMPMARAGLNPLDDARTLAWLVRTFRQERPGLVLAYTQKPIIYGGIAARIAGVPRYYAMNSGLGHVFSDGSPRWLRVLVRSLYSTALARAAGVFVFNGDDFDEMRRQRMIRPDTPCIRVPGSGVDIAHYAGAPVPPGPPRFLMIARLLRSKGVHDYVEAARRIRRSCPGAQFALLGPLDPNPSGIDAAQVAAWRAEGAITYLGEVRDVRPVLAAASVFVLPSWYREGLPRTILEALATGRAVITTDTPGCREPIEPGVNGLLVPPRDVEALEAAMIRFVDDPGLAERMGGQSRRIAVERYAVDKVNALLLSTMGLSKSSPACMPLPAAPALAGASA